MHRRIGANRAQPQPDQVPRLFTMEIRRHTISRYDEEESVKRRAFPATAGHAHDSGPAVLGGEPWRLPQRRALAVGPLEHGTGKRPIWFGNSS